MDSDLHVIEPRTLWEDYLDPKFRGRIVTVPGDYGSVRAHVDGKVLPPYADRPEHQRAWAFRYKRPAAERLHRGSKPKEALEAMDSELWGQKEEPSELFHRQCWVSIEPEEKLAKHVVDELGDDNFVVSTDWPHDDSRYPHAIDTFLELPLGKESKKKVLWDNCARLYNLS